MFSMNIDSESESVVFKIRQMTKNTKKAVNEAFALIGKDLKDEAVKLIEDEPKTGRVYRIKGRLHRASAPGESPANLSGDLKKSVNYNVGGAMEMTFGASTKYAGFLERGTSRMAKRPYLIKAIHNRRRDIFNHFKGSINRYLGK